MILGLDISTSITGYTIVDNGKIILNGAWDTRKYKNFFDKVVHVKDGLDKIRKEYGTRITAVYIEQSLQSFRSGFSSAKTLSTLSRFNGIVSWLVFDQYGIQPEYIAATSARKLCGIKVSRGQKAKQVVLNFLLDNEPSFVIEYTRNGNPKPESYDKADSIVIARAGAICEQKNSK
jgi:Holliday junction resolvasome RuvABC endonuclease subunit|tara:strand:- start:45 stop:572 length:528 start_codon:yes stop_codon:yes gene_type:complete